MAADDLATNLYASLVKFVQQAVADAITASIGTPAFVDFDAHADIKTLPAGDVMGLRGFSFTTDDRLVTVNVAFAVSSFNDPNLFRQRDMINLLYKRVKAGSVIDVVDAASGDKIGWLKARNRVDLSPTANSQTRPYQQISVSLVTDQAG